MKFSHRLKAALNSSSLNQSDLARALQVKPQSVQQWLSGKNFPRHPRVKNIAQHLNVSAVWLSTGEGPSSCILQDSNWQETTPGPDSPPSLPLVPWFQLNRTPNHFTANLLNQDLIYRPCACSDNAFALKIEDKSMYPRFFIDDVIVVDPDVAPQHNDYVIASKRDHNHSVLRQNVVIDGITLLSANNPDWPDRLQKLDKGWFIQGTVISKHRIQPK